MRTKTEDGSLSPVAGALTLMSSLAVLILTLSLPIQSQDDSCEKRIVIVNVRDKHGQFVPLLQASDFRARIQETDVDIVSAVARNRTLRVVIALDASSNMIGLEGALRRVTDEILRTSSDKTQFALLLFSDRILKAVEFGSEKSDIASAVSNIPSAAGHTALRDSLLSARKLFGAPQAGDSVIVVSNSADYRSKTSMDAVTQAYLSAGIRLSVIRPFKYEQSEVEKRGTAELSDLASSTGGFVNNIMSPDDFASMDQVINQQLEQYYALKVRVPAIQKATSWQVEVVDSSHRKRKDIKTEAPQKLLQCTPSIASRP